MQRNLTTWNRRSRHLWLSVLAISALLMTACGPLGSDDDDTTPTAETISQPTTDSSSEDPTVASDALDEEPTEPADGGQASPTSGQESIAADGASPPVLGFTPEVPVTDESGGVTVATPDQPFTVIIATPAEDTGTTDPVATPSTDEPDTINDPAELEISGAEAGSDGTSGASLPSSPAADNGTPVATPEVESDPALTGDGTPVDEDAFFVREEPTPTPGTPLAEGSPVVGELADLEPVTVTSCAPENVPQFGGEQTAFLTNQDVNFRIGPGSDCDLVGEGPIGISIPVTLLSGPVVRDGDDEFVWVQVQIADTVGWIVTDVLEPAP